MPRTHPPYPPEYRQQIVELVRAGRWPEELAREFGPRLAKEPSMGEVEQMPKTYPWWLAGGNSPWSSK